MNYDDLKRAAEETLYEAGKPASESMRYAEALDDYHALASPATILALLARLGAAERLITGQDKLLVAYRVGSHRLAGKAIDELESARKAYKEAK